MQLVLPDNEIVVPEQELLKKSIAKEAGSKSKVLFVIDTLQLGGAEQSLLENTVNFKHINSVVCHLYPGEILKPKFIEKGIPVYSFGIREKYGFVQAYKELKKVVSQEKPDLIVAYLTRSEIVSRLVAKYNNIPVVGTFVNDLYCKSYNQHLSLKSKIVVQFFKQINKLTSKICVGFVSNSQSIKDANAKHLHIQPDKIRVINRGRNSKLIVQKNSGNVALKTIRFLNVSRLFPVKAQANLINGFKQFSDAYKNATLDIVGDGPLRDELKALIHQHRLEDKVTLLGARKDVPQLLHQYDCFVFPSLVEGFSGAVVEAMFAKLPVLASDIDQNKEAITHMQTGYLFNQGSAEAVAKAMFWFSENRATAAGFADNAYEFARQNFEQENIVQQFEKYLLTTIGAVK